MTYIISPKTGRAILIGGPTYEKLKKSKRWGPMLRGAKKAPSKAKSSIESKSHGCSNMGKYPGVKDFCGPEGGACPGTYPVNTPRRARAALAYARHAPNPEGIRRCVKRVTTSKGW